MDEVLPIVKFLLGGVAALAVVGYVMSKNNSYEKFLDHQIKRHMSRVRPKPVFPFRLTTEDEGVPYKVEPKE